MGIVTLLGSAMRGLPCSPTQCVCKSGKHREGGPEEHVGSAPEETEAIDALQPPALLRIPEMDEQADPVISRRRRPLFRDVAEGPSPHGAA